MKTDRLLLLLRALLLSTSSRNIYRYTKDQKKKSRITGNTVAYAVVYFFLMVYAVAMCAGYGFAGLIGAVPVLCALTVSAISFFMTLFKTNGYLFNFREYDMLMSLPFESKTVAAAKFLYMYIKSLPWHLSISVALLIGYGIFAAPPVYIYPVWLLLTFILPVIPMLAASFLGFLIARVSAGFRKTNAVQTILVFVFVIFTFSLRFILEDLLRNDKLDELLENFSGITDRIAGTYLPAKWFADAVTCASLSSILLLIGVSALLFAAVFAVVGRSYRSINSALKSHAQSRSFRMTAQKQQSVLRAIAFKEFRRLLGSTTYMTNGALGEILAALVGIVALVIGADRIVGLVLQGAPIDPAVLQPAIPFIVYFFIGMMATTACSPSLEGKNYWIVQSLPIEKKTLYQGKMYFNMLLSVPFMVFAILCLCISGKVPVPDTVLYLVLGILLCAFSTAWGCVCGIRHMRLDWENEVEVIKQGAAVTIYLLPNMFVTMGLIVLVVVLGMHMDARLLTILFIVLVSVLATLSYARVMALAKE